LNRESSIKPKQKRSPRDAECCKHGVSVVDIDVFIIYIYILQALQGARRCLTPYGVCVCIRFHKARPRDHLRGHHGSEGHLIRALKAFDFVLAWAGLGISCGAETFGNHMDECVQVAAINRCEAKKPSYGMRADRWV
jgi:hypothetical protein